MAKPFSENTSRPVTIREFNDQLRRRLPLAQPGSRVLLTAGVQRLREHELTALIMAIRDFSDFTADNDPHGEHDFGAVEQNGERFFWKIDAYDRQMEFGSPDPLDPSVTMRVLTILRADEW
ncbi:DUF3768 domain-containing protein [Tardiphaga alba]|uniref:DUF3768 domain-containing protein n=1 Tax=Tardiphaga alba TaxID=340268 RepID=A0ABX8ABU1_9BRAD|nr:DUF3768 domain-containing protein [Tardiphaga alba]QUS40702.1 DUF3768 domain-containing protein [Tardiphaga alba]